MPSIMLAAKGICQHCGYAQGTHRTDCPCVRGLVGYVVCVLEEKRYGFIKERGQPDQWFFFPSDLTHGLVFGPQLLERYVRFELATCRDGRQRATNVRPGD
jgi:hypothetical protein